MPKVESQAWGGISMVSGREPGLGGGTYILGDLVEAVRRGGLLGCQWVVVPILGYPWSDCRARQGTHV